jgi:hypothetical protein
VYTWIIQMCNHLLRDICYVLYVVGFATCSYMHLQRIFNRNWKAEVSRLEYIFRIVMAVSLSRSWIVCSLHIRLIFSSRIVYFEDKVRSPEGRAMAQVVSRRPLTAEARVIPCGMFGDQSSTGRGFSPSSSIFSCQYIIPPSLFKLILSGECVLC